MDIVLHRSSALPPGAISLPEGLAAGRVRALRFGCITTNVSSDCSAPPGQLRIAPDLWERLAVPYDGIRMSVRLSVEGQLELGPTVAVLYPGSGVSPGEAEERLNLYYGHLFDSPGLLAIGFDEAIDWNKGTMKGFVLEQGSRRARKCWFPIPAVVRLTWSIRRDVIDQLRDLTGEKTFNWVRNMGKWQFHSLLSEVPELRDHLPDTRLFGSGVDLKAMLARHHTVFVKNTFGIQGRGAARLRRLPSGFELRNMDGSAVVERLFSRIDDLVPEVKRTVGKGRSIVQQGIPLTGRQGRALDFRVVTVRDGSGSWRVVVTTANVAPNERLVFTNLANGALDQAPVDALQEHYTMTRTEAEACLMEMSALCLTAAEALAKPFHPLGILGFDVGVATDSGKLWLLEANTVPGWGYPPPIETDLARSQADYALFLSGFRD